MNQLQDKNTPKTKNDFFLVEFIGILIVALLISGLTFYICLKMYAHESTSDGFGGAMAGYGYAILSIFISFLLGGVYCIIKLIINIIKGYNKRKLAAISVLLIYVIAAIVFLYKVNIIRFS
jgi:hypothetical protein